MIALCISVSFNAFFYYFLDALWVVSTLSPSIYIAEIFKVLGVLLMSIVTVGLLMDGYDLFFRCLIKLKGKSRLKLYSDPSRNKVILTKIKTFNQRYVFWQNVFVTLTTILILMFLVHFKIFSATSLFFFSIIIGLVLAIFNHQELKKDRSLKFFVFFILTFACTFYAAYMKCESIDHLPQAILKNDKTNQHWQVLNGGQDKMILLQRDSNDTIKVVKFDEIDRIISNNK